jgi:hypothetical protein
MTVSAPAGPGTGEPGVCSQVNGKLSQPVNELNSASTPSDKVVALGHLGVALVALEAYVTDTPSELSAVFGDAGTTASEMSLLVNGGDPTQLSTDQASFTADMVTAAKSCPAESAILTGS